jgi:hypothetical protein
MSEASDLRRKLALVGLAKQLSAESDLREHLALPLGERLLRTIRLSDSVIRGLPEWHRNDGDDDEAATWARVHARLHPA